jgi:hypothetical protein
MHMAKKRRRARPEATKVEVTVPVPQNTKISVADLKSLNDKDLNDLLKKAKTAKVGFVILNAPFKARSIEPVG